MNLCKGGDDGDTYEDDFIVDDPLEYHYAPEGQNIDIHDDRFKKPDINKIDLCSEYLSLGPPTVTCSFCHALMWKEERVNKKSGKVNPEFSICCSKGTIELDRVKPTPPYMLTLHADKERGPSFKRLIRSYNSMLSFTSMGGKIDYNINKSKGPYVFRLNGVTHHRFGSLLPNSGDDPKFCQLYIYDTENEIQNRIGSVGGQDGNGVDPEIVEGLVKMLDDTNNLVKEFRKARDRFKNENVVDLRILIESSRSESGRENHMMPSNEVGVLMVDNEQTCGKRDIILESNQGYLQRISDLHPLMMALQYPLLFPYAEDGYHENIFYNASRSSRMKKRQKVTMREFYSYVIQVRKDEGIFFA